MTSRKHPILCPAWLALAVLAAGFTTDCFPQTTATNLQPKASRFQNEIEAFERSDRTNPPPQGATLFIGSSSIALWKTLAQDFPGHRVINRGFGGSEIVDSTHFAERVILPCEPRMVFLRAG